MIWTSSHLGERGQIKTALISSHTDNYFISRTSLWGREASSRVAPSKYSVLQKMSNPTVIVTKLA